MVAKTEDKTNCRMRQEWDRFGSVQLREDCLWGIQTQRCLDNLSFSNKPLKSYPELIKALAQVKEACASANLKAGVLGASEAGAIAAACALVIAGEHHQQFPVDVLAGGGSLALNLNINEVLANLANISLAGSYAPIHPKEHVNIGQSTADVCHTAFRLAAIAVLDDLLAALTAAITELDNFVARNGETEQVARTCMQDAMITNVASQFAGYSELLKRRRAKLESSRKELHAVNLGGTVIGSGDGAHPAYREAVLPALCKVSGLNLSHRQNLFDAAQNADDLAELAARLGLLARALAKIATDLRILSSGPITGINEINLPAVQDGSSFFAGKVNPVIPESVMHACFAVYGCERAAQAALECAELNLNIYENTIAINVIDASKMLSAALSRLTEGCLSGMSINESQVSENVEAVSKLYKIAKFNPSVGESK